ncbi:uncharacterized protein LOC135487699 isoform X2 [Lineus longissimus]|uniref:uncharacterized protein LOC135487699 isoform X2 n=1 Tax=Lineus longissimus TaxID=88925 RepID=UPI00315E0158
MAKGGSEMSAVDMAEFAIEAALLQGCQPHSSGDLEVAIPCRCYGRGLTRADFTNVRWPAAMLAAAARPSKVRKVRTVEQRPADTAKKELSPVHKEPKLCSRGRGQLMSRSAAEYDMIQSRRLSRSSGKISNRLGSIASEEENDVSRASNVPGHHIQDCPTKTGKTEKDRRSEKSDWRAQSPKRSVSPVNSVPSRESSQPPFHSSARMSTPSPPIQPLSSALDFFRPEWLEKQNDKQLRNQKQTFDINVNISKTKTSGFGMNDVNRTPKSSAFSQQSWEDSDKQFSKSNMDSGFHISSHDDADLFMKFGGFKPVVKKEFNLETEEFPGLAAAPMPEQNKGEGQRQGRRLPEKKPKGKKVKMVSYNLKENSPSKQPCGVKTLPQPATYSHAVQTPKDCQLMVQGLPVDCVKSEVLNLMEPYGQVVYINMQKDHSGYASAIVGLDSPEKVEWVIDCLSGAESLFNVWLMHPASVDPLTNSSLRIVLTIGIAIVQFADPHSLHWIIRHSPYLDFKFRSLVDGNPNTNDVALSLPTQIFNADYLSVLTGEWMKSKISVSWSHLDMECLLKAAAFLQIESDTLKPRFPGSVDIHNVSRFSAAFWCHNSAPPHLNYKDFIPLFLYDMNYDMSMFDTDITRKNFLLKMRSNFRSNIRFSTAWNPKWLDDKRTDNCPLTHIHECNTHLTRVEIDDLVAGLCIDEWKDRKKEFMEANLHRMTCMRFPKGFGPILLEHACQYFEAKTTLKTERLNEK